MALEKVLTFEEYLFECECGGGGGVAFATPNGNGMGNVVAPTVGSTPGSVWQSGSGTIGSGDSVARNTDKPKLSNKKSKKSRRKKYYTKF